MKFLYAVAIVLIFIALAFIGLLFEGLKQVNEYRKCYTTPISELSQHCKEIIYDTK